MTRNTRTGPAPNLEDAGRQQMQRAPEEDQGVNYDDELDDKRVLDDGLGDRAPGLPSERRRQSSVPPEQRPIPEPTGDGQPPVVSGENDPDEDEL